MTAQNPHIRLYHQGQETALERPHGSSITGSSDTFRQKMLDDTFVLKDIARLGQWVTLYAASNTGKKLLTLWLLKEVLATAKLDGDEVFYINAEDSFKGIVHKTELAEEWGFNMVVQNHNGFTHSDIVELMIRLAETGEAKSIVVILDTFKKFQDLVHKRESSKFGKIGRALV